MLTVKIGVMRMARPFQSDSYMKNAKSRNVFQQSKNMNLEKDLSQQKKDRLKSWITFYRHNMARFVEHYMGVKLYPYQRFWINLIAMSTNFLGVASRASAKSWLIAVYAIAKCILYPGTIVALCSSTKAQAGLIISSKCVSLIGEHPNIAREVSGYVTTQNKWEVSFHNGSKIDVVISDDRGRGHRSTVSVLEERRLIPTEDIDSIIRPFAVVRQPPYLMKQEFSYLKEEPQEIIITSAYYKSHEWWVEAKKLIKMIVDNDSDVKAIFLDYLICLKHGIKTQKQMKKEKEKFDPISFLMEYGNVPYSSSNSSFFKVNLFKREIKTPWLPLRDSLQKKNPYDIRKTVGEKRIVAVDIAMRKGSANDNTVISCARLLPTKKGWKTEYSYIESHNGKNANLQALRIKQLFYEFTNNEGVLVLDIANFGITVYDILTSVTKDETRGIEYPALTVMNHESLNDKVIEELRDRTLGQNAIPCIYPINATLALNSAIAVSFRDRLKRRMISFLVDDNTMEEALIRVGNKDIIDQEDPDYKAFILQAAVQTTLLINECISLESSMLNGQIKLDEPSGGRKDRYTSCSYLNYYVSLIDKELLKDTNKKSNLEALMDVTYFL